MRPTDCSLGSGEAATTTYFYQRLLAPGRVVTSAERTSLDRAMRRAAVFESYSIRRPEIARLMTNCWISLVPSKIVWLTLTGFVSDVQCCHVALTRASANRVSE